MKSYSRYFCIFIWLIPDILVAKINDSFAFINQLTPQMEGELVPAEIDGVETTLGIFEVPSRNKFIDKLKKQTKNQYLIDQHENGANLALVLRPKKISQKEMHEGSWHEQLLFLSFTKIGNKELAYLSQPGSLLTKKTKILTLHPILVQTKQDYTLQHSLRLMMNNSFSQVQQGSSPLNAERLRSKLKTTAENLGYKIFLASPPKDSSHQTQTIKRSQNILVLAKDASLIHIEIFPKKNGSEFQLQENISR